MDKTCKYLKLERNLMTMEEGRIISPYKTYCLKKDIELPLDIQCKVCKYYEERPASD